MTTQHVFQRLLLALALLTVISCETPSQKAEEIFGDRTTLPKALDEMANPLPPTSVISRAAAISNQKARVSVAVIDNGTDYLHPDLINQIKFDVENGRVVGAGLDVMGNDRWPHPNLIRSEIFSFGAREVKNQRIYGAIAKPMAALNGLNQLFVDNLLAAISKTPELTGSLFQRKLNKQNVTIFNVIAILKAGFDVKNYADQLKNGKLFTPQTIEDVAKGFRGETVRELITNPWQLKSDTFGTFTRYFSRIEHADIMFKVLEIVMRNFNSQYKWEKFYTPFEAYYTSRQKMAPNDTHEQLYSHWYSEATGAAAQDPRRQLATSFCEMIDTETFRRLSDPKYAPSLREKYVDQVVANALEKMMSYSKFALSASKEADVKEQAQTFMEAVPTFHKIYRSFISTPERTMMFCDGKTNPKTVDPEILNYVNQRGHSLIDQGSANQNHGTHTAGIIARQSSRINIVPVRIVTATPEYVDDVGNRIRKDLESKYSVWLQNPIILRGVLTRLGSLSASASAAGALGVLREYLDDQFKAEYLDFYFFYEILKSIEYVGAKKIKIASMSLGTEFNKGIESGLRTSRKAQLREAMKFLVYEFFKYLVAEQLEKYASKTLFVIAAGNSSQWVDGNTRSALPCDLSSPYFAEVEAIMKNGPTRMAGRTSPLTTAVTTIPNNRIKNVLCVGSLNSKDELSSFTNLPLTGIPFVLSYGEAIQSPIKASSCDGVSQEYINTYGLEVVTARLPSPPLSGPSEADFDPFYVQMGWLKKDATQFEKIRARSEAWSKIRGWTTLTGQIQSVAKMKLCLRGDAPRARLSGTSMATPGVAGFIGRVMAANLFQMKLSESEAYDHPDYSPEHIIQLVVEKSPRFGGSSLIQDVRKVVRIRQWPNLTPAENERVLSMPAMNLNNVRAEGR